MEKNRKETTGNKKKSGEERITRGKTRKGKKRRSKKQNEEKMRS